MNERNIITELSGISLNSFLKRFDSMTIEERNQLLSNPYLDELNPAIFTSLFLKLTKEEAKKLLTNQNVFHKVVMAPKNNRKRNILNIIGEKDFELLKYIFENEYFSSYKDQFCEYIKSIRHDKFQYLLENMNLTHMYSAFFKEYNIEELEEITKIQNLNKEIATSFLHKTKMKQLNPLGILKVKNEKELLIYTKFGLSISVLDGFEEITLDNGLKLPYQDILTVSESQINRLIKLLKEKGNSSLEDLLEVALKLYFVFGYDNARKIIMDKFTNITPLAITRITDYNFQDHRRDYRTKHQERFYYYQMENDVIDALENENHEFFTNFLYDTDMVKVSQLEQEFIDIVSTYKDKIQLTYAIKEKLFELINKREVDAKKDYIKDIKERLSSRKKRILSIQDLKELLQDISLLDVSKYNQEMLLRLQQFLLGNKKADNDCILRLIINKEALGLNQMLGKLINQYDVIESIASKNKLSLNSVLNVIDIVKTSFFSLKPNEQDIFLSTLAKIISSKEYCNTNEIEIIKETCKLHIERKNKVYASIPTIEGKFGNYHYYVAPFDAEYLLAAGVDSKNCFRISGKGEEFFRYCLTSNQAVIMYFTNSKTHNTYICPIIRSGNAIHCNGIDPELPLEERETFFASFNKAMQEIIAISKENSIKGEQIEVATITDLHLENYFEDETYLRYQLETYIPLDQSCYTDYNKKDKKHYIITKSDTYQENKYYLSNDKFYQKRKADYEFNVNKEYDKNHLTLIVNSIAYSAIDYKNISLDRKNEEKRNFVPIDVNNFRYIVGNKDWYVAIDNQFNILANLLPYDERARKEYFNHLAKTPLLLENMMKEENNYGINR